MSVLDKLACSLGRRDEIPNQALARELVNASDKAGIKEIADNLCNRDKDISFDCIKVLYEIGYLKPELISDYVQDFLKIIQSKNNRLVWGGMLALATIAHLKPKEIFDKLDLLKKITHEGSVITVDNGIKTLAVVASTQKDYSQAIFPFLIEHLETCRPKDVPQHSEKILVAVNAENKKTFMDTLNRRLDSLGPSQLVRVKKVIHAAERK